MSRNVKLINLAVLAFYLSYALLPLLYSTESLNAEAWMDNAWIFVSPGQRSVLRQNVRLAALDEQSQHSSDSSTPILLKKKRAIISFKEVVAKLFPQYAKSFFLETSLKIAIIPAKIPENSPNCPDGFFHSHSGLSPPSV